MGIKKGCNINATSFKISVGKLLLCVTLIKAVNSTSFLCKALVVCVEWVILRIYLTFVYTVLSWHSRSGLNLTAIAEDNCNFFVIWVYSFFHCTSLFNFQEPKDKGIYIVFQVILKVYVIKIIRARD